MRFCRRFLQFTAVALAGLCVVCGDDGASTDTPPPPPPTIEIPSSTSPVEPETPTTVRAGSFCEEYRSVEQQFEQAAAGSIEDARVRLDEVVDQVEGLAADVPSELRSDFEVIVGGFQQMAALADEATSLEELRAEFAGLDVASFDEAGRAIEEWAQANC
jgi:hypothetical protein